MNKRIKELAEQADNYAKQTVHYYQGQFNGLTWEGKIKQVRDTKFAELVRADEREACAAMADVYALGLERNYSEIIADEIRARGEGK